MDLLKVLMEVVGAVSTLATSLALLFPKGSKAGYVLAKVGADIKGHTCPEDVASK